MQFLIMHEANCSNAVQVVLGGILIPSCYIDFYYFFPPQFSISVKHGVFQNLTIKFNTFCTNHLENGPDRNKAMR